MSEAVGAIYTCDLCREGPHASDCLRIRSSSAAACSCYVEHPFQTPVDEIGATLMQAHLKDKHDVAMLGVFRTCPECGTSILCNALKDDALTCKDHQ